MNWQVPDRETAFNGKAKLFDRIAAAHAAVAKRSNGKKRKDHSRWSEEAASVAESTRMAKAVHMESAKSGPCMNCNQHSDNLKPLAVEIYGERMTLDHCEICLSLAKEEGWSCES